MTKARFSNGKLSVFAAIGLITLAGTLEEAFAQETRKTGSIGLDAARAVTAAASAEAAKASPSSVVVVDSSGSIVLAERMDGAFPASAGIAQAKAQTAAAFWQSTANLENAVNSSRPALLSSGFVVMQGGIPLLKDGQVVGAVGVSGGTKDQDEAASKAGAAAFEH